MSSRFSTYLDLIRFCAAIVVLLSHFAYERYSDGTYLFIRELNLGSDAVVIFFVLSGFVIAHVVETKDRQAAGYFFNRGTRLLSVVIPALILTFAFDRIGAYLIPAAYADWWYNPINAVQFFLQGLTFSNEWTGLATRLGTNGPYWSISYEAAYYILFGIFCYLTGIKRILLLSFCILLFGINVLLLAPCWLMGAWAYHLVKNNHKVNTRYLWLQIIIPPIIYAILLIIGSPGFLMALTSILLGDQTYVMLRFSNEFIWNTLIAGLFTIHLMGCKRLMDKHTVPTANTGVIKWLAGATFSIYLVHYPTLQFLSAVLPKFNTNVFNQIILLSITLLICFIFAQLFERNLSAFRHQFKEAFNFKRVKEINIHKHL